MVNSLLLHNWLRLKCMFALHALVAPHSQLQVLSAVQY